MIESLASSKAQDLIASLGGGFPEQEAGSTHAPAVPSSHYSPGVTTSVEERALVLLGSGIAAEAVAAALGVTPSRISQLLAGKEFADRVAHLRYENLQSHNARDSKYDTLEDRLLDKLEKSIPLIFKPVDILKAISTINGAKRRGQSAPEQVNNQQNIVNLVLPISIAQRFSVDINNQVTRAGEQELHTMPAGNLLKRVEAASAIRSTQLLENQMLDQTQEVLIQCETIDIEQEVQLQS